MNTQCSQGYRGHTTLTKDHDGDSHPSDWTFDNDQGKGFNVVSPGEVGVTTESVPGTVLPVSGGERLC